MTDNPTPRSLDLALKLGMLYIEQKKYELAKQTLTQALEGAADLHGEDTDVPIMVDIMAALSSVCVIHGDPKGYPMPTQKYDSFEPAPTWIKE